MLRRYHSKVYEGALVRFQNVKAICEELGLEKKLAIDEFEKELNAFGALQNEYNSTKALLDAMHAVLKDSELKLRSTHEKMLLSVAITFGKDSTEYVQAGGKRKVDRKKPVFKRLSKG